MPIYNFNHQIQQQGQQSQPFAPGLRLQGPGLPVQIEVPLTLAQQLQSAGQPIPTPVPGFALIDTGASISAVDVSVMQNLAVHPIGIANVGRAGGPQQQNTYPARFVFPGTQLPSMDFNQLIGANLAAQAVAGSQLRLVALLGRDILQHFILIYNGTTGSFSLAF